MGYGILVNRQRKRIWFNRRICLFGRRNGKVSIAAEVFNCNAPDTGNMEVLERYGTSEHKNRWLYDLLDGKIRSAYVMTEPNTASSDAAQLTFSAVKDGEGWVLNGEKWWISGAGIRDVNYIYFWHVRIRRTKT